jgi:hypothetical protein
LVDGFDFLDHPHWHAWKRLELRRGLETEVHLTALNLHLSALGGILILVELGFHPPVIFRPDRPLPLAVIEAGL